MITPFWVDIRVFRQLRQSPAIFKSIVNLGVWQFFFSFFYFFGRRSKTWMFKYGRYVCIWTRQDWALAMEEIRQFVCLAIDLPKLQLRRGMSGLNFVTVYVKAPFHLVFRHGSSMLLTQPVPWDRPTALRLGSCQASWKATRGCTWMPIFLFCFRAHGLNQNQVWSLYVIYCTYR